jgi:hypothetical protein
MEYEESHKSQVTSHKQDTSLETCDLRLATHQVWPVVSPPDAIWKAPYSARFHGGASVPGG